MLTEVISRHCVGVGRRINKHLLKWLALQLCWGRINKLAEVVSRHCVG